MRKLLAILLCKVGRFVGSFVGKGSSLPGRLALRVCPDILKKVTLPPYVVAVTGSNGKTSTVEMIAHILRSSGKKVVYNKEGSNQIEGVTTFLLCAADLRGRVRADVVLLESDERFARHTFSHFVPTHYVILNLYRDQLTRNGHPQWMYRIVEKSIHPESKLILNADDPLVARYGLHREGTVWFGVSRQPGDLAENTGAYDDGAYCPACFHPMTYDFYHYNHIGSYHCAHCGLSRPAPRYEATALDPVAGVLTVEGQDIHVSLHNIYHCYNTLAAYALCRELGVSEKDAAKAIDSYALTSGRVVEFRLGGRHGTLLTSKHENSVSYDQSIRYATQTGEKCTVVVLVDAISRKYFTSETSWLWDVAFERLGVDCVEEVVLTGRYCHDLAVRFDVTGIPTERVRVVEDIGQAVEHLKTGDPDAPVYVITCFSDKEKFLSLVEVEK